VFILTLFQSVYPLLTPTTAATTKSNISINTAATKTNTFSTNKVSTTTSLPMSASTNQASGRTIGFIGCGTIAQAIATGLLTQTETDKDPNHMIHQVYVTKRSEAKSTALSKRFGDRIVVTEDNQEIVDQSDLIFLCVLPQFEESVLKALNIGHEKTLISLVVSTVLY
jgi:ornithine cyclodeaminase/alanine dehydrogenase-like protein (mu-crystallin family)